ncbi:hypothetical protein V1504DRAFT_481897 [Lipomyces starkeyi]
MAVPLVEGMAQLKWSWFRDKHRLSDFVLLNSVSQSVAGGEWFCFTFCQSLAIGPFAQQVVSINSRTVPSESPGSIQICTSTETYLDYAEGAGPGLNLVPLNTIGAIYEGIFQSQSRNSSVTPACASGNCTFRDYQSLGFCSQCADISSEVTHEGVCDPSAIGFPNCTFSLPNGLALGMLDSSTIIATSGLNLLQVDVNELPNIVKFTALTSPGLYGSPADVKAAECALYFCVITYHSEVIAGQLTENITSTATSSNKADYWTTESVAATPGTCIVNGTEKIPPYHDGDGCTYIIDGLSGMAMANTLSPLLSGSGTLQVINRPQWSSNTIQAIDNLDNINNVFTSLSTALTAHARTQVCAGSANGTVWIEESYIHVQWSWMIFPAALVGLNAVFFFLTMAKTREQYIWKSSPLPLLLLGSNISSPSSIQDDPRLSHMEDVSSKMNLLLEPTNAGVKLVTRTTSAESIRLHALLATPLED